MKRLAKGRMTITRCMLLGIFVLWISSCGRTTLPTPDKILVGLQPLGGFNRLLMDTIKGSLERNYHCRVVILKNRPLPVEAFVHIKSSRYRADSLLRFLLKIKPDTVDYMMGLTSQDISTTKRDGSGKMLEPESKYRDWGVFGLGFRPGNSCVISTYRIYHKDSQKFTDRLIKICVHEFGHNMGLHHCPAEGCVMQDAVETIKTVDNGTRELCSFCRKNMKFWE